MKALRILADIKVDDLGLGLELNPLCVTDDVCQAIEEIEDLQNKNKSLVKTLEKYNEEMIELRKENQDLKSRSCVTCKYGHTYQFDEDIECMKLGADTQGLYFEKDFYCKNWELKNERD